MSSKHYAYGSDRAPVETVMRLQAVKRWHMIDTSRAQTLAEHSANVALLAYGVSVSAPGGYFGPAHHVASVGLLHDLEEVYTGDIPSNTKAYLTGLGDMEHKLLPAMFRPTMTDPNIMLLVKLCDLADGIRFIRLHGIDHTAAHAQGTVEEQWSTKFIEAGKVWPNHILQHVADWLVFYAYEEY